MYIYLEGNNFIPLKEIIVIVDYEKFIKSNEGKNYFNENKRKVVNLSKESPKTLIITDKYFYISSYVVRSFMDRGNEYNRLKNKGKLNLEEVTEEC